MFRRQKTQCSTMTIFVACPTTARTSRFDVQRGPKAIALCVLSMFVVCAAAQASTATPPAQKNRVVIGAGAVLDGRGHMLRDTRIIVEGAKIVALDPKA